MLIKLDDAIAAVMPKEDDAWSRDAMQAFEHAIAALRALPTVSDGWEDIARSALESIADLPDPGEEKERSATFYRVHVAMLKQIAAKALGRETVSKEALDWAREAAKSIPALGPLPAPPSE